MITNRSVKWSGGRLRWERFSSSQEEGRRAEVLPSRSSGGGEEQVGDRDASRRRCYAWLADN